MRIQWAKVLRGATWCVGIVTMVCTLYIMANGLGLVDSLDFGAGAYYYADIPSFEQYVDTEAYRPAVPTWVCIVLFLGWGWLMYRLWGWLEGRNQRHQQQPHDPEEGRD